MRYRNLGRSGLRVSVVGVGCNAFGTRADETRAADVVRAALDAGVTLFDTADTYAAGESERLLGKALSGHRDDVVIATKFGMPAHGLTGPDWQARGSRSYLRRSVEGSLRRLGTDRIDLYQLHQPDPSTPIEETLSALDDLVTEGKIGYYGCSNFHAWELAEASWAARNRGVDGFVSAQNEYSLYNRSAEIELAPACTHLGVGLLPYFPLAYGLLTGKYARGEEAPEGTRLAAASQTKRLAGADFDRVDALQAFADQHGVTLLEVAIGGLRAQPAVTSVIAGATRPEQVEANVAAGLWEPTADQLAELATINAGSAPGMSIASFR